jgi:hypothetical protein
VVNVDKLTGLASLAFPTPGSTHRTGGHPGIEVVHDEGLSVTQPGKRGRFPFQGHLPGGRLLEVQLETTVISSFSLGAGMMVPDPQ